MSLLPFNSLVCWQITLTLLHVSWIGLVIGLIAAFANRVLRDKPAQSSRHFPSAAALQRSGASQSADGTRSVPATLNANRRYWMNFVSLLLFAASLPVTFAIVRSQTAENPAALVAVETPVADLIDLTPPDVEERESFAPPIDAVDFAPTAPQGPPSDTEITAAAPTPTLVQATPSAWDRATFIGHIAAPYVAILYAIGVALMFVKLAFGVRVSRQLRSASTPISDPTILARMAEQAKKLSLRFTPVIAYCEHTAVPIVVGLLRPMILIPAAMVNGLTIEQLESVLTHELAHLRRRDHLMIVVQRVLEAILFFHPVTWYLSHRLHDDRETSCDELVLSIGGDRLQYAQSLLRVAELRLASKSHQKHIALAADGQRPSKLRQRIARLLGDSESDSVRVSSIWVVLVLAGFFVVGLWSLNASSQPVFAAADENQSNSNRQNAIADTNAGGDAGVADAVGADDKLPPLHLPSTTLTGALRDADGIELRDGAVQRFGSTRFHLPVVSNRAIAFSANSDWIWGIGAGLSVIHRDTGYTVQGRNLGVEDLLPTTLAVSVQSNRVAVAGSIGRFDSGKFRVVMFDSNTGVKVSQWEWEAVPRSVEFCAISGDGKLLLTGGSRGDVRLWDAETGDERKRLRGITSNVRSAAISPDGKKIVLVGERDSYFIDAVSDRDPELLSPNVPQQWSVCYSPDGQYFATSEIMRPGGIRIWDGPTGALLRVLPSARIPTSGLSFTPDSKTLVVPSPIDNVIHLWNVESKELTGSMVARRARSVAMSPDGKWLAALGDSQRIRIFDLETRTEKVEGEIRGQHKAISAIRFLSQGRVATIDKDSSLFIWDVVTGKCLLQTQSFGGLNNGAVAVSPDRTQIAMNAVNETVYLLDLNTGEPILAMNGHGRTGSTRAVHFSANGNTLLTWGDNSELYSWSTADGQRQSSFVINVPGHRVDPSLDEDDKFSASHFSHDGSSLYVAFQAALMQFDTRNGRILNQSDATSVIKLDVSSDGRWIVSTETEPVPPSEEVQNEPATGLGPPSKYVICLREAKSLKIVHKWHPIEREAVACRFSPDSSLVAWCSGGESRAVEVAEVDSKKVIARIPQNSQAMALEFSPDNKRLATGNADAITTVWEISGFALSEGSAMNTTQPAEAGEKTDVRVSAESLPDPEPVQADSKNPWTARIHGLCTDADHKPIEDVIVRLFNEDQVTGHGVLIKELRTDATGRFDFGEYPELDWLHWYSVTLSKPGYGSESRTVRSRHNSPNQDGPINSILPPAKIFSGRVIDPDGQPIADAKVRCGWNDLGVLEAVTDNDGKFEIRDYQPMTSATATARVIIEHSHWGKKTYFSANCPGTETIQMQHPAVVEGIASHRDGTPATSFPLFATYVWEETASGTRNSTEIGVYTDENGRFQFRFQGSGRISIRSHPKNHNADYVAAVNESFEIVAGETRTTPPVMVTEGALIVGRVASADAPAPFKEITEDDYRNIFIESQPDLNANFSPFRRIALLQSDGSYRLRVPPGKAIVRLRSSDPSQPDSLTRLEYSEWPPSVTAQQVTLEEGQTYTFDFKTVRADIPRRQRSQNETPNGESPKGRE